MQRVEALFIVRHEEPRPQDDSLQTPAQLPVQTPFDVRDGPGEGRRIDAVVLLSGLRRLARERRDVAAQILDAALEALAQLLDALRVRRALLLLAGEAVDAFE